MEIANSIGFEHTKDALLPYYCNFLADSESEVRTAAVRRIADFCQILDQGTIGTKILPSLKKLQQDSFPYVRSQLAENLLALSPLIDKSMTNEHIIPVFLTLLRDEASDVRLNLFKRLEDLNKVIGIETLS